MSNASSNKLGCLGVVLQLFGIKLTAVPKSFPPLPFGLQDEPSPFCLRDDFLSAAEISFYHILLSAVGDRFTLCPKVNLSDIFFVSHPARIQAAWNRISAQAHRFFVMR